MERQPLPAPRPTPRRGWSRRQFLHWAGLAALGLTLVNCQSPQARRLTKSLEKVQLVYQDWRTDWFPPMAQRLLEQFHASHPNLRVFYTLDPEDLEGKMLADFQAGTAPDVFQGCCSHFPIWAQKGYLLDLTPYVKADLDRATIEDWDPVQYKSLFTREGRQYGLPKYHGALALYYNKDLFDQYGVDYPSENWTHDDYLLAMQRLTRKPDLWGSMVDVSWDRIQVHINGWGGHLADPDDPTRCLIAEPPAMQAMEWIRARMWDDKVMATSLDVQNMGTRQAFVSGRLAMVEDGSWALKDILSGVKFRIGVAPFPAGPARRATLATTDGFAIYAGTKYPEAAWELVKFLISQDYGRAMAQTNFLQPARASLVEEWVGFIREQYPTQAQEMNIAAFADGHRKGYSVIAETFANMADAQRIIYAAWQRIFTLGQSPVNLMQDVSRQVEEAQRAAK